MRGSLCNHIPSAVLANRGVPMTDDDNTSGHKKLAVGPVVGGEFDIGGVGGDVDTDGAGGDIGGTIVVGVGAIGDTLGQNKLRKINLKKGRQNRPPRKNGFAATDRSDLLVAVNDSTVEIDVIGLVSMYSGFLVDIDVH